MSHVESTSGRWQTLALAGLLSWTCGGCGGGEEATAPTAPDAGQTGPAVSLLAPPTGNDPAALPPGHPPLEEGTVLPAPTGDGGTEMVWDVPVGWIVEQPASNMRKAQYRVPGSAGDGEFVVFYFGPGQGGDPQSNAARWADQFSQPDGSSSRELMVFESFDVNGLSVMRVEVTGTYINRMVSDEAQPGHMLLGAIVGGPDANWFFKLTGPQGTVEQQREAFAGLLSSLRAGG